MTDKHTYSHLKHAKLCIKKLEFNCVIIKNDFTCLCTFKKCPLR